MTCGSGGVTKRERYCENPEPANGGNQCGGESVEIRSCAAPNCREYFESHSDSMVPISL